MRITSNKISPFDAPEEAPTPPPSGPTFNTGGFESGSFTSLEDAGLIAYPFAAGYATDAAQVGGLLYEEGGRLVYDPSAVLGGDTNVALCLEEYASYDEIQVSLSGYFEPNDSTRIDLYTYGYHTATEEGFVNGDQTIPSYYIGGATATNTVRGVNLRRNGSVHQATVTSESAQSTTGFGATNPAFATSYGFTRIPDGSTGYVQAGADLNALENGVLNLGNRIILSEERTRPLDSTAPGSFWFPTLLFIDTTGGAGTNRIIIDSLRVTGVKF